MIIICLVSRCHGCDLKPMVLVWKPKNAVLIWNSLALLYFLIVQLFATANSRHQFGGLRADCMNATQTLSLLNSPI